MIVMSKYFTKFMFFLVLLAWLGIFLFFRWLATDEPLSKTSQDFFAQVRQYNPELKQDPYFYVLGFDAKPDISPEQFGQTKYHAGWAAFYRDKSITEIEKDSAQQKKMSAEFLTEKDQALLKKLKENAKNNQVYQDILTHKAALQAIDQQQTLLKKRFQMYMALQASDKPLLLSLNHPYPNYGLILSMNYLYISQLAYRHDLATLQVHIEQLKQKLSHPENLVEKMVVLVMLRNCLDLLNDLNKADPQHALMIPELTPSQLSVQTAFATEFASPAIYFSRLNREGHESAVFDMLDEQGGEIEKSKLEQWFYSWVSPFVFQNNMSTNQLALQVQKAVEWSSLDDQILLQHMQDDNLNIAPSFQVKNYLGQRLVDIANFDLNSYDVRIRMLDQKIRVLNLLAKNRKVDLKQLNHHSQAQQFSIKNGRLCMTQLDSLISEEVLEKYNSCLTI